MIEILRTNPLLLLFLVVAIGYPLGRIRLGGVQLGVAAILFVGLAFGALDPQLALPEPLYQLGLAFFVYSVGLSSGPGFFASFRGKGLRDNLFIAGVILFGLLLTLAGHLLFGFGPAQTAGLFTGTLTSTPALAAAVEYLKHLPGGLGADAVVGYSIAYPVSVLGMLLTIYLVQRLWKVDYAAEGRSLQGVAGVGEPLTSLTIQVVRQEVVGRTVPELVADHGLQVILSRFKRQNRQFVAAAETRLELGDLITVVGTPAELRRAIAVIGCVSGEEADLDRSEVDAQRLFISNPRLAGLRLRDLQLPQRYGAVITRVRRGDVELLPHADLVLQLGDAVRVVARRANLADVGRYFGDSYRALSEIDIATLSLGLTAGLLLGLVPIPLFGGVTIRLGAAGGPLIVALILGAKARTGRLVWTLPYSANLLLRQIGLTLFLAGVGVRSGYAFVQTLTQGNGLAMIATAAVGVVAAGLVTLYVGHKWLKIPMGILVGMVAGMQTQAATLGFALEQTENELPNIGYATIYPVAMVFKIILVQILLTLMR